MTSNTTDQLSTFSSNIRPSNPSYKEEFASISNLKTTINTDLSWDQRIPNEPYCEWPYVLKWAPILYLNRPLNTDPCYLDVPCKWVDYNQSTEKKAYQYYQSQGARYDCNTPGTQVKQQSISCPAISPDMYIDTTKPWINGVSYNIDTESCLKSIDYQNAKDCINQQNYNKVNVLNRQAISNIAGLDCHTNVTNVYMNETMNWFNNQTKAKMIQSDKNRKCTSLNPGSFDTMKMTMGYQGWESLHRLQQPR